MTQLRQKIGGAVLGFSLIAGAGFVTASTVEAQYPQRSTGQYPNNPNNQYPNQNQYPEDRNRGRRHNRSNDGYPNLGGSFQLRQTALNAGYNTGVKEGRKDRSKRRRHDIRSYSSYQRADADYNSRDGDKELYRRYFQMAFETGYNDGLDGN